MSAIARQREVEDERAEQERRHAAEEGVVGGAAEILRRARGWKSSGRWRSVATSPLRTRSASSYQPQMKIVDQHPWRARRTSQRLARRTRPPWSAAAKTASSTYARRKPKNGVREHAGEGGAPGRPRSGGSRAAPSPSTGARAGSASARVRFAVERKESPIVSSRRCSSGSTGSSARCTRSTDASTRRGAPAGSRASCAS